MTCLHKKIDLSSAFFKFFISLKLNYLSILIVGILLVHCCPLLTTRSWTWDF
jgi:hypothetical protein